MLMKQAVRPLLYSQVTAAAGETFFFIALATFAVQATGSGLAAAWILAIKAIATFTVGFGASWIVDRFPRKVVMLCADYARIVLMIPFFFISKESFWLVYVFTYFIECCHALFHPARESYIQSMYDGEERMQLVATVQSQLSFISILGPSIAGAVIALVAIDVAFIVNIVAFLLSALFVQRIPYDVIGQRQHEHSFFTEALSGWRYIWREWQLRKLNMTRIFFTMSLAIFTVVSYPLLAQIATKNEEFTFPVLLGIVSTIQGVGAFGAGVFWRKYKQAKLAAFERMIAIGSIALMLGYGLWMVGQLAILFIGSFCIGIALVTSRIGIISIGQKITNPQYAGRALAAGDALARLANVVMLSLASFVQLQVAGQALLIVAITLSLFIAFSYGKWNYSLKGEQHREQ